MWHVVFPNKCFTFNIITYLCFFSISHPSLSFFFPAVFCQIPCLNGGRCIGRDLCWCPSNSTGKFCHLPVPPPARPTSHSHKDASHQGSKSPSHSMYTLPLSNQQGNHWAPWPMGEQPLPSCSLCLGLVTPESVSPNLSASLHKWCGSIILVI